MPKIGFLHSTSHSKAGVTVKYVTESERNLGIKMGQDTPMSGLKCPSLELVFENPVAPLSFVSNIPCIIPCSKHCLHRMAMGKFE